jgi:hypothetical protein
MKISMEIRRAGTPTAHCSKSTGHRRGALPSRRLSSISINVVRMVVESMLEHGEHIPEEPADQVEVTVEPRVAITV